jgi:hypothetical protein
MQIVSQEISTRIPTMTVKYTKEGTFGPVIAFFAGRLHNVENNCYTVLVIIAHNALVGVGTISSNYAITLSAVFGRLIVWHKRFDEFIRARTNFFSKILKEVFAWYVRITLQHHWFLDFGIGRCGALAGSKQRTCIEHFFCVEK